MLRGNSTVLERSAATWQQPCCLGDSKQPDVWVSGMPRRSRVQQQNETSCLEGGRPGRNSHPHPAMGLPGLVATTDVRSPAAQVVIKEWKKIVLSKVC